MILLLINIGGIFQGASVCVPEDQDRSAYRTALFLMQIFNAIIFTAIVIGLAKIFYEVIHWNSTPTECMLIFLFLFFQQLADFERRTSYIFDTSMHALQSSLLIYPARLCLFVWISPTNIESVLIILALTALAPATLTIVKHIKLFDYSCFRFYYNRAVKHIKFSQLLIASAPLGWLWSYIPVFALGGLHGKESVAILVSIRNLANVANVLMEQLETVVSAQLALEYYSIGKEKMKYTLRRLAIFGSVMWISGLVIILAYGAEIVLYSLGVKYIVHRHILLISWLAYGLYFISRLFGLKYRTIKNLRVEFVGGIASVIAAGLTSYPLISSYDIYGAAWVFVIISATGIIFQALTANLYAN